MVNLRPPLLKTADVRGKAFGRSNSVNETNTVFRELAPLALKNFVEEKKMGSQKKICSKELLDLLTCMSKFDQQQSMCELEASKLSKCEMTHRAEYMSMVKAKEVRKKMPGFSTASKNEVDPSPNQRINSTKMNVLMWKFPRSNRERKDYNPQEKKIW